MRIKILILVLLIFCIGCSTYKNVSDDDLIGSFYGLSKGQIQGSNTQYDLELKEDSVFILSIKGHDFNPRCDGVWKHTADILILECSDNESIAEKLSNGYMNQREFVIKIKNRNKLKLDNLILKRK